MSVQSFISNYRISGIITPLGYEILPQLSGPILVGSPLLEEKEEGEVLFVPYDKFFSQIISSPRKTIVFLYDPDYLSPFLKIVQEISSLEHIVIVSPYYLDIGEIPWLDNYVIGFPTTVSYSHSHELRSPVLVKEVAKYVQELQNSFSRILILVPDESFLSPLLYDNLNIQFFELGKDITSSVLAVIDKQARLAAYLYYPDCIIDTCQTNLLFNTTMGGYYNRLVHRSKEDCDSLALLSSLRSPGYVLRMTSELSYNFYPEKYPIPDYLSYDLIKENSSFFPDREVYYGLPMSLENNKILSLWIKEGHAPFSLLGPLTLLDNFSTYLFIYPLSVYSSVNDQYLPVAEQSYKTFFSRFVGRDSLETLAKIWEAFLDGVGTFTPTYDEVKVWSDNNSLSVDRLWSVLQSVQSSVQKLEKQGVKVKKGPSSPEELRDIAAPLFASVYSSNVMKRDRLGFEKEGKIYYPSVFLLPSSIEKASTVLGLILENNTLVVGIAL